MSKVVSIRYSDDGGENWSNWKPKDAGEVGQFLQPLVWRRLGQAREERIWEFRDTSVVSASILAVMVQAG